MGSTRLVTQVDGAERKSPLDAHWLSRPHRAANDPPSQHTGRTTAHSQQCDWTISLPLPPLPVAAVSLCPLLRSLLVH